MRFGAQIVRAQNPLKQFPTWLHARIYLEKRNHLR